MVSKSPAAPGYLAIRATAILTRKDSAITPKKTSTEEYHAMNASDPRAQSRDVTTQISPAVISPPMALAGSSTLRVRIPGGSRRAQALAYVTHSSQALAQGHRDFLLAFRCE